MTARSILYQVTDRVAADNLLGHLGLQFTLKETRPDSFSRTYLDSFDWLLYSAGLVLARDVRPDSAELLRISLESGRVEARSPSPVVPTWPSEITGTRLREAVSRILDVRAILPIIGVNLTVRTLAVLNEERKTTARVIFEELEVLPNGDNKSAAAEPIFVARLVPVRGYVEEFDEVQAALGDLAGEPLSYRTYLERLFDRIDRRPLDRSSKFQLELDPEQRSDEAVKRVCLHLLDTIELNEDGVIRAVDTEFLHDFRVAIRRTRSVLGQFKRALPKPVVSRFREEFRWLGRATGPLRDMDVYLIRIDDYASWLSEEIRTDLAPLRNYLLAQQKQEHRKLVRMLHTKRYRTLCGAWRDYLVSPPKATPSEEALVPIGVLARTLTWRMYKRAVKQGAAIVEDPLSPPSAMHMLRITCKKLRYLMELFRSLYPAEQIKEPILLLKRLQDCLGDYQDFAVQQEHLRGFAAAMHASNATPVETYLAMGRLEAHLDVLANEAEKSFSSLFRDFSSAEAQELFADLFKRPSAAA